MDVPHVSDDDLVLHYYGELGTTEEAGVSGHINRCQECHGAYRRLQQVLMQVDEQSLATPELPDGFERTVWARLEPSLGTTRRGWIAQFVPAPSRLAWAAAALVMVAGAFHAGRLSPKAPATSDAAVAAPGQVRERILLVDLSEHLDRSQRVLVELVSAEGPGAATSGERERAEQLVVANRLYRATASSAGDTPVVDLLDQLERVLVEVAASPSDQSASGMEEVRRRIESGSLLFKVRVISSDLDERQKAAVRQTGQRSSL
jgi:anti-sigma factor RsiW